MLLCLTDALPAWGHVIPITVFLQFFLFSTSLKLVYVQGNSLSIAVVACTDGPQAMDDAIVVQLVVYVITTDAYVFVHEEHLLG